MKQERHLTAEDIAAEEKRLKNKRKQIEKIIRRGRFGSYKELKNYIFSGNTYSCLTRLYVIEHEYELTRYIDSSIIRKEGELRSNYWKLIR